ncbi:ABC transporter substrate-binding protein [Thermomonospora cellulosilytica]|uniref:Peptide/nickel transport system substrate-binding protein n=1 Tax=Thermomonospora cellulosilytica TaxID=1411118 RepID=A0A7W3MUJ5_9ACTN|nr:ABC transporter substrate-binding protein [Thermomonospora cellulosilytica]MBA9002134.1 peptide/nickel transport system substrate-binding protein [Thermomonospora cellulosilytica]
MARRAGSAWVAGIGVVVLALAGCGAESTGSAPRAGGTLQVVGAEDVEHLDPASAGGVHAYGLNRVFARTLLATGASNNFDETVPVQADVAERVPTKENGGISKDGKTYTVRLRRDVQWDTRPARAVVAEDFVRGFERLCNPAAPSPYREYYIATVKGMAEFCDGYQEVPDDDAEAMAAYQKEHSIAGVKADGDRTLVFTLIRPATDFLNMLALPSAAAAPEEYDEYVPDGPEFRRNTISNGPYRIASYQPGRSYVLEHNPAWRAASDPLRERHVDRIRITFGVNDPEEVQRQIERGTADLSWDQPVPVAAIGRLRGTDGFTFRQVPGIAPYLVMDGRNGPTADRRVRQAVQYAVDRTAVIRAFGGPEAARPLHTLIAPGNTGYFEHIAYPSPGDAGDPARCQDLLGKAGHEDGLELTLAAHGHEDVAEAVKESVADCGIKIELRDEDADADLALVTPRPDWFGNNGRSALAPLLEDHPDLYVRHMLKESLNAPALDRATGLWNQLDRLAMQNASIVPLVDRAVPIQHSARVRGARFLPPAQTYDYTRLWLTQH